MFQFTFGDIGSGKSLKQADTTLYLLHRAKRNVKKYGLPLREVWCNFHLSKKYEQKYKDNLRYWSVPQEMIFVDWPNNKVKRRDFDLVWDEMAVELPSDKWKDIDPAIRRFFAQHRKRGVEIYGNTQDYMMLDINARRMATSVFRCHKLIGSRDPSSTLPPVKHIWGIVFIWQLDKQSIRQDDQKQIKLTIMPEILWISKELCQAYDTTEDIDQSTKNRLMHVEYACDKCDYVKTEHFKV